MFLLIHKLEGKIKTIIPKPESTSYMFQIEFMSDLGGSCSPEESFLQCRHPTFSIIHNNYENILEIPYFPSLLNRR